MVVHEDDGRTLFYSCFASRAGPTKKYEPVRFDDFRCYDEKGKSLFLIKEEDQGGGSSAFVLLARNKPVLLCSPTTLCMMTLAANKDLPSNL